jgi:lipoprotein-anchoring transpeptidase ErfK/SrfK
MWIEWRNFTNGHWRFEYALLFGTFCLGSLVTIALINFVAFEGRAGQTKRQALEVKPQADRTPSNRPGIGELAAAAPEAARNAPDEADYPRVEVDLSRQMLKVFDASGKIAKVLPISSGSGRWYVAEGERQRAVTPTGRFRVYRKIPGWRKSRLGLMYYPVYVVGGVAIHGSPHVPRRPASHGCIRIPMHAAKAFYDATPIGTLIVIHG